MELVSTDLVPFFQILIAVLLGSILGIQRSLAGKTAGMRTYGLVAMGSCLLIVISELVTVSYVGTTSFDPMRLAAGIVTGIGFIGAGLIIFKDSKLSGLTTAAGLWVVSAIGMAVGFKLYALSIFATFLTLFVLTVLWSVEQKITTIARNDLNGRDVQE